jgi:hypothetical protein
VANKPKTSFLSISGAGSSRISSSSALLVFLVPSEGVAMVLRSAPLWNATPLRANKQNRSAMMMRGICVPRALLSSSRLAAANYVSACRITRALGQPLGVCAVRQLVTSSVSLKGRLHANDSPYESFFVCADMNIFFCRYCWSISYSRSLVCDQGKPLEMGKLPSFRV